MQQNPVYFLYSFLETWNVNLPVCEALWVDLCRLNVL